jgi:hypothetical protein
MHTAAWFLRRADRTTKTLDLLVYFEGAPGWYEGPTDYQWKPNESPATIDMKVGSAAIHIKYWAEKLTVQVMDSDFSLAKDNVLLVSGIDRPIPRVTALGTHDLKFASEAIPAVELLKRDPAVLAALLGEDSNVTGKARSDPPAELEGFDRQGLDLLAKNEADGASRACDLFSKAAERGYAPLNTDSGSASAVAWGGRSTWQRRTSGIGRLPSRASRMLSTSWPTVIGSGAAPPSISLPPSTGTREPRKTATMTPGPIWG